MITSHTGQLTFQDITPGQGLTAALGMRRSEIIGQISAAGLKGRGGAGFPVGVKWNLCAAARGERKYVVCNADEGEPGTFKDRVLLAEYPDLLFEGMTIAALAVGAREGILYLRAEYAYLRPGLEAALARRREQGLLGNPASGTAAGSEGTAAGTGTAADGTAPGAASIDFDIRIQMGAGAYVCGEETALIESLEGHRGEPRNRPPFPVDTGFLGRPTVVNNVETLCWAASILVKGAAWFKAQGTAASPGPKLLSVSGDCARPGVYELPFGATVAQLLALVGGEDAKGVQIGGASGHMIPPAEYGRTIAFEDVSTGGSVIVIGPGRDMLAVAHNFLDFFREESCGQCTPCREGNAKLLEGVELLQRGRCSTRYLNELRGLSRTMQISSKCGLGQSSPNAFLSILDHYSMEIMGRTPETNGRP